jgi:hypothetical protein
LKDTNIRLYFMDSDVGLLEHHNPECTGSWIFFGMGDAWCWSCSMCEMVYVESDQVLRAVNREAWFSKVIHELAEEGQRLLQHRNR